MNTWVCTNIEKISSIVPNSGQNIVQEKYRKTMLNLFTGELNTVTDVDLKKSKKRKKFLHFLYTYLPYLKQHKISAFAVVIEETEYATVKEFNDFFRKKLKRMNINFLGYVWCRDVGSIKNNNHIHLIVATDRINGNTFNKLFRKKKHKKYVVQLANNLGGLIKYLTSKDLFASNNQRSYGASRAFKKPNKEN